MELRQLSEIGVSPNEAPEQCRRFSALLDRRVKLSQGLELLRERHRTQTVCRRGWQCGGGSIRGVLGYEPGLLQDLHQFFSRKLFGYLHEIHIVDVA